MSLKTVADAILKSKTRTLTKEQSNALVAEAKRDGKVTNSEKAIVRSVVWSVQTVGDPSALEATFGRDVFARPATPAPKPPAPGVSIARMTFSELLGVMKRTETAEDLKEAITRLEALPIVGTPFGGLYERARAEACKRLYGESEPWQIRELVQTLRKTTPSFPMPSSAVKYSFEKQGGFGQNGVITAGLSALAYQRSDFTGDQERLVGPLHDQLARLGFPETHSARTNVIDGVTGTGASAMEGGARAIIARHESGMTAIGFRGTASTYDVLKDLDMGLVSQPGRYGAGKVHRGFDAALESVWPDVRAGIVKALEQHPNEPLVFTGHSLGGALAVLAVARAQREGLLVSRKSPGAPLTPARVALDTYGQPRVGDAEFASGFARALPNLAYNRHVYSTDPVARLGPTSSGFADIPSARVVFTDAAGSSSVVRSDDPRLKTLEQDLGKVGTMVSQALEQLPDHAPLNYVGVALRNGQTR